MPDQRIELGHLAHPDSGTHPGVVMVHDVWGVSDHTRDMASRLADEGFVVLAVDLYRREESVEIASPGEWMRGLSDPQALADIQAGIDHLAASSLTAGRPIGVTGFCMGGMYALMAACSCTGLSAAAPFYGLLSHDHGLLHDPGGLDPERKPRSPIAMAPDLSCPLLAFFGEEDEFVPVSDVRALEAALAGAGAPAEVVIYPGAGHAFMNDTRADAHRPEVAARAWRRLVGFLSSQLGP